MKRKLLSVVLSTAMAATVLAGCGSSAAPAATGSETADTEAAAEEGAATEDAAAEDTAEETADDTAAADTPENVVDGDIDAEDAFVIYGWNEDVKNSVVKAFSEKYPEDAKRIVFVNTGGTDYYQGKIDPLLEDPSNKYYPDMFAMEMDYILKYTDSDYTLAMDELGFTDADYANMYGYTVEAATVDGKVKGLSWQAAPGCMVYRRSLADKYLGVSEPEDVQEFFKDWDTVKETAQIIQDKSEGKTRLYCGYTELQRPYMAQRTEAWLDADCNLKIDPEMIKYMEDSKEYVDKGYASAGSADQQWQDNWSALKGSDEIFAFTSCTWFNQWCLLGNFEENFPDAAHDWGMIQGPCEFYWGGTWLGVGSGCSDTEMAAKVLSVLCDKDAMKSIYTNTSDFPNNKETVKELIAANEENDVVKMLGGQNFLEFFAPIAENIKLPKMCGEDFYINNFWNNEITTYVTGEKDLDTAIADFKTAVKEMYDYVNVE